MPRPPDDAHPGGARPNGGSGARPDPGGARLPGRLLARARRLAERIAAALRALPGRRRAPAPPRAARAGKWGEGRAADFLKKAGYAIIGRNVRPDRRDELDIIARRGDTLVFVEVKTRARADYAPPVRAIDARKRHALNRAAAAYLRKNRHPYLFYRFDVIEVVGTPESGDPPRIRHLEGAVPFEPRFVFPVFPPKGK